MNEVATIFDASRIDAWADRITACWRQSVEAIIHAGRLLTEAKAELEHGDFRSMCLEKLPFSQRTAERLIAIAADARLSNPTHVSLLPPSWGTLYEITRLDDAAFAARIADGTINPEMDRKDITASVKQIARETREHNLGQALLALPDKRYGVIVADPEWRFEPWSRKTGMARAADNKYPTSCTEVIAARDVPSIAAKDCVLFLWATVPMLQHALLVMDAWGFDYRSNFVWVKDKLGTGYWNRNAHELLLIGVRGNPPAPAPGTREASVIEAPRGEHSAKPEIALEYIEGWYPTLPKIELNRRGPARPGWDAWGDQALPAPDSSNPSAAMIGAPVEPTLRSPESTLCLDDYDIPDFLRRTTSPRKAPSVTAESLE